MFSLRYIGSGDATGYGLAAAALVRALVETGADVVWEPLRVGRGVGPGLGYEPDSSGETGPCDLRRLCDGDRRCSVAVVHTVPEYYPYFVERERAAGTARIWGHTVWETDRLPAHWPALIDRLDGVIVPTEANRRVFRDGGVRVPIAVVPHLPTLSDRPASAADHAALARHLPDLGDRRVFYSIATWLERKGIAPMIEAFVAAFRRGDPVELVLKTTEYDLERTTRPTRRRPHPGPAPVAPQLARMVWRAALRHRRLPPRIRLLTATLGDGEMRALHEVGTCFVSLSRAEGWGLGAYEAAWLGKPAIVTGRGGPTAFLTPETAYFVDWTPAPVRPAVANGSYTPDQTWAEPDVGSAVAAMRAVFERPEDALARGARARLDVRERFRAETVARAFLAALETTE